MPYRLILLHHLTLLVASALVLAACGSGASEDPTQSSAVVSLPATTATTEDGQVNPSTAPSAGTTTASTEATAVTVVPALGVDVNATDSFDADRLDLGTTNFVSMDDPLMVPAPEVTWLAAEDVIMGLVHDSGETHAYPINQMAYHHIANTTIAGEPFLVTY